MRKAPICWNATKPANGLLGVLDLGMYIVLKHCKQSDSHPLRELTVTSYTPAPKEYNKKQDPTRLYYRSRQ